MWLQVEIESLETKGVFKLSQMSSPRNKAQMQIMKSYRKLMIAISLTILVGFWLSSSCLIASASSWTDRASTSKQGGYGQAVVGTSHYIYTIRCYNVNSGVEFWRYDPSANRWETLLTGLEVGTFRNGTALAWDGSDSFYALAGARYEDTNRRVFLKYSIPANKWETLPETPAPQGAGDASCWSSYDSKFYALLGVISTKQPSPDTIPLHQAGKSFQALSVGSTMELRWLGRGGVLFLP